MTAPEKKWGDMNRREKILALVDDAVGQLVYYDRKEDDDIGTEGIAEAVEAGELTLDEMVAKFRESLTEALR